MYLSIGAIFFFAVIIYYFAKWHHESKTSEIEHEQQKNIEQLQNQIRQMEMEQQEEKNLKKEIATKKEIAQILNCSDQEANKTFDALYNFMLLWEFKSVNTKEEKEDILQKALNRQRYYEIHLLPIIEQKGLSVTADIIGSRFEYFENNLYSDISMEEKLSMIDTWDYQKDSINRNTEFLLKILQGTYIDPFDKFSRYTHLNLTEEDFANIFSCFNTKFKFNASFDLSHEKFQNLSFKNDYYSINKIFTVCLFFSDFFADYYDIVFGKEERDVKSMMFGGFSSFISDLFFSVVNYDLADYENVIDEHLDSYIEYAHNWIKNLTYEPES